MKMILMPWTIFVPSLRFTLTCFETLLLKGGNKALILILLSVIICWHIYTPIHELLHVAGCVMTGGTVTELALPAKYGGSLLQNIFPFIVLESEYAGQLTGFSTPNYWSYAVVDFLPYVLSLPGLWLLELARRKEQCFLFGLAVILAFIPFMSIPGDYYEAVSLITTQLAEAWHGLDSGVLISDDVFKSIGQLQEAGLLKGSILVLIILGIINAIYLALMTLGIQVWLLKKFAGVDILNDQAKTNTEPKPQSEDAAA